MCQNKIEIAQISNKDLFHLKELYKDAFNSETDYDKMNQVFNLVKNNNDYIILCAKKDNKVVGSVLGVVCYELIGNCTPFLVIEDVAVLSSYRRLGIARELMLEMEKYARAKKCNMVLFVSSVHRYGAHKLYESLGYGVDKVNGYRKRLSYD
jgi:ribosomal protein S18 acetylase RimI-like enzyme